MAFSSSALEALEALGFRFRCRWPTGRFTRRAGQVWPRGAWRSSSASLPGGDRDMVNYVVNIWLIYG